LHEGNAKPPFSKKRSRRPPLAQRSLFPRFRRQRPHEKREASWKKICRNLALVEDFLRILSATQIMKTKGLFLAAALLLGCFLSPAEAQPFTTLYNFTGLSDGSLPAAGLMLSGNTFYGTASSGGNAGFNGAVFALNANGTDFTNLYDFSEGATNSTGLYTNNDGAAPQCSLILSGNTLYGTASAGGKSGYGTVFSVNTNGNNFKTLYPFTNGTDGGVPIGGLVLSGNTLFGTASQGGASGKGTVFSINTNGTGFNAFYSFTGHGAGSHPQASLILSGNTLYGTAQGSGGTANGVVFSLNTNGGSFVPLHEFSLTGGTVILTNSDGAGQIGGLILSGGMLYGTASAGGSAGYGTVFSLNTGNSNFITLYAFTNGSDGANPLGGLVLSGDTLYGTTCAGVNNNYYYVQMGTNGFGTVFSISAAGSNFTSLYAFTGGLDGFDPEAGLILSGNTLYGTAFQGGNNAYSGSVFALSASAHRLSTLLSFNSDPNTFPNGQGPEGGLVLSGGTLYGTAASGGCGVGSVFSLNTNGTSGADGTDATGFAQYSFYPSYPFVAPDGINVGTNSGGIDPQAGVILSGNTLYGTAMEGGIAGFGTVFSLNTNSLSNNTGFETLYAFTNGSDGAWPQAGLVLSGSTLYGTTFGTSLQGGTNYGTVFAVSTSGLGFVTLHNFSTPDNNGVNSDGATPQAGLVLSGGVLYGTAPSGGAYGGGTVFAVNAASKAFTTLYSFSATDFDGHNSDGDGPVAGLIISGNTLYGTATGAGASGAGTVFSLNLNTVPPSFKTLYNFTAGMDGASPEAGLLLSGNTLYGTTFGFGVTRGTIFAVPTNGTSFTTLYAFAGGTDGIGPQAGLILSGGTLYGTAYSGGYFINYGTVFALNISSLSSIPAPIALNIQSAGKSVILSWNDPAAVFSLQAAPIVNGLYTNVPGAASPFTNAITASPKYFRLIAPN
jgi:uncharacterized repeat protein (TIGR03803 family)